MTGSAVSSKTASFNYIIFNAAFIILKFNKQATGSVLPYLKALQEESEMDKWQKMYDSLDYQENPFLKNIRMVRDVNEVAAGGGGDNNGGNVDEDDDNNDNNGNKVYNNNDNNDDDDNDLKGKNKNDVKFDRDDNNDNKLQFPGGSERKSEDDKKDDGKRESNADKNDTLDGHNDDDTKDSDGGDKISKKNKRNKYVVKKVLKKKTKKNKNKSKIGGYGFDTNVINSLKLSIGKVHRRYHDTYNAGEKQVLIEYFDYLEAHSKARIYDEEYAISIKNKSIKSFGSNLNVTKISKSDSSTSSKQTKEEQNKIKKLKETLSAMWLAHIRESSPTEHVYKLKRDVPNNQLILDVVTLSNLLLFVPHIVYTNEEERLIFTTLDTLVKSFPQQNGEIAQAFLNELTKRFVGLHRKPKSFHLNHLNLDELLNYPMKLISAVLLPIAQQLPNIDERSLKYEPALLKFDSEESYELVEKYLSNKWPEQDMETLASEYFSPILERDGTVLDELNEHFQETIMEFEDTAQRYDKDTDEFIDLLTNPLADHDLNYYSAVQNLRNAMGLDKGVLISNAKTMESILKSVEELLFIGYSLENILGNYNEWYLKNSHRHHDYHHESNQNQLVDDDEDLEVKFDTEQERDRNYMKEKLMEHSDFQIGKNFEPSFDEDDDNDDDGDEDEEEKEEKRDNGENGTKNDHDNKNDDDDDDDDKNQEDNDLKVRKDDDDDKQNSNALKLKFSKLRQFEKLL